MVTTLRCTVCANPVARKMIDACLDDKMSAAGISRYLEDIGATVSQEVISRHRKHYDEGRPVAPKGTRKGDLAVIIRDKVLDKIERAHPDELDDILLSKGGQGMINTGLGAQKVIDTRERVKAKTGRSVELLTALFALIGVEAPPEAPQLADGLTIEGAYEEVEPDGEAD